MPSRASLGYTISHDVSEREFQIERTGTWDKGKSCETFNPMRPATRNYQGTRSGDPQALGLPPLGVNGELPPERVHRQHDFRCAELDPAAVSQFMVLRPGDLVNTGTPAGVALGGKPDPKPYLRPGDVAEASRSTASATSAPDPRTGLTMARITLLAVRGQRSTRGCPELAKQELDGEFAVPCG